MTAQIIVGFAVTCGVISFWGAGIINELRKHR